MKIVYCIPGTYRSGGMERVLANKANYLSAFGHEVYVITSDQRGQSSFFEMDPKIRHFDLDINYETNNGASFWKKLVAYPGKQRKHKERLQAKLLQIKPDIVISMFGNEASFLPKIKDGSKKVLEIHFSKFKRLQYGRKGIWKLADILRTYLDERLVKKYDRFIVLTHEDKSYWGSIHNIEVIPNSIPHLPDSTSDLIHKQVIAIGRYTHQKGFDDLITIWSKVHDHVKDWRLVIVGDGELKDKMRLQIQSLGLSEKIQLLPPTSDIAEHYLSSSILVLTSRYEGLPMILLEGQSYGLPIVAYRCKCGPSDVISEGVDGFLINEGDKSAFSDQLISLMEDIELRQKMGKAARKSSYRYDEGTIMEQWLNLFNKLICE